MKLILVRHCRTDWNAEHRMQGHADRRLDEFGHTQSRALAAALKNSGATHIYSSDLLRARETAEYIASALGLEVVTDARLREFYFGTFEGRFVEEVNQHFNVPPGSYWLDFRTHGGESAEDVRTRMIDALDDIRKQKAPEHVPLIVTHGAALIALQKHFGIDAIPVQGGYRIVKHHGDRFEELFRWQPDEEIFE
jgi:probable phosphoglycerate mutase